MLRKSIFIGMVLIFAFAGFAFKKSSINAGEDKKQKESAEIQWYAFDKGLAKAQAEGKVLVVDFYTDWCHWCKEMDKQTYSEKNIIKYASDKLIMAKLNAETEKKYKFKEAEYSGRQLSQIFGVTGFPTTAFVKSNGELITAVSGFISPEKFIHILKYLAENHYETMKFDDFVKQEEAKNKS